MGGANPLSIERAAAAVADDLALVFDDGASYTFGELAARTREVAAGLRLRIEGRAAPAATGELDTPRVAIVAEPRVETVVALLVCWEHGWTPVLVHPRLTADERLRVVKEVNPAAIIDETFAVESRALGPPVAPFASADRGDASTPAAIVYTSGTAGTTKGVLLSRHAFVASARASQANIGAFDDDRWLLSMPLSHIGGLSVVVRALVARRPVVVARFDAGAPERLIEVVARHRVTIASLVPTMLRRVLDAVPDYRAPGQMRAMLLGGAASPPALLAAAAERSLPVLTTYGLTEACSQVATQTYGTRPGADQGCGPPLAGVRVRIVDDEIHIAGPTVMMGYFAGGGSPVRPFVEGGWFPTGDLGELDGEGRLHIRGRHKELIITGGENVHPLEVEQALEACPAVSAACAFGVPDEVWGEIVAAAIVARDHRIGDAELYAWASDHARRTLASFRRPRLFARLAELVTTAGGKLDRRATAELARPLLGRVQ